MRFTVNTVINAIIDDNTNDNRPPPSSSVLFDAFVFDLVAINQNIFSQFVNCDLNGKKLFKTK